MVMIIMMMTTVMKIMIDWNDNAAVGHFGQNSYVNNVINANDDDDDDYNHVKMMIMR